jgi:hypothetical protein
MLRAAILSILFFISATCLAKIEIAGVGEYIGESGSFIKNESAWHGLIYRDGKYQVCRATASVVPEVFAEDEKGVVVSFEPAVIFAVHGMNLNEGQTVPGFIMKGPMAIDPTEPPKDISFGTVKAKIYGTMTLDKELFLKRRKSLNGQNTNYKIVLESGGTSVVIDPPIRSTSLHNILWIGDLNNDGFPDILTQPGVKESTLPKVLLMSKRNGKKVSMENIGEIPGR